MDNSDIIIKQLHDKAAELLARNVSDNAIIIELKKMGVEDHYADMILQNVKEDKSDRKEFYKHLFSGIFVLAAGIALTIGTYTYAQPGGMYIVFGGFMVYGIFSITRAFVIFRK